VTFQLVDEAVPLRDAATVVLLRDGADGLEVFMLKRNMNSDFVGGAYVFPGGGVDPEDRADDLEAVCAGRCEADAVAALGRDQHGLALWVAAIRECFEEAGVLLAYDADGRIVDLDDPASQTRWQQHRAAVDGREERLVDVCEAEGLRLAVDGMHYFSHWLTPERAPRRYDTYFFLAAAPEGQTPLHDDHEVIANEWVRPADALHRSLAGELTLLPPTIAALEAMRAFDTVEDALAAAATITDVPAIMPTIVEQDGRIHFVLPGQPGFDGQPIPAGVEPSATRVPTTGFDGASAR
jgi:8-oxo-dGTP pyrophosphatase MutT (NUDIX family)